MPDVTRVLLEPEFWDIYYEHCSHFSLGSLARLLRFCKFEVIDLSVDFGDQYLLIEAKPTEKVCKRQQNLSGISPHIALISYFDGKTACRKSTRRKRVLVWGSGSKCVSFLKTLNVKDEIKYAVDINPHRHGKFIPGASKKIMPPQFLKKYEPDVTKVMNSGCCHEIKQMLDDMEVNAQVISV